jgi:hypothetical protein
MRLPFVITQSHILVAVTITVITSFIRTTMILICLADESAATCTNRTTNQGTLAAASQCTNTNTCCAANQRALTGSNAAIAVMPVSMAIAIATVVLRFRSWNNGACCAQHHGCT